MSFAWGRENRIIPENIKAAVQYGKNLQAMAVAFNTVGAVSTAVRMKSCLVCLTFLWQPEPSKTWCHAVRNR